MTKEEKRMYRKITKNITKGGNSDTKLELEKFKLKLNTVLLIVQVIVLVMIIKMSFIVGVF